MFIGCRLACSRAGPMCRIRHRSRPHRPPLYKRDSENKWPTCLLQSLAASKGRALICEATAFGATQEKRGMLLYKKLLGKPPRNSRSRGKSRRGQTSSSQPIHTRRDSYPNRTRELWKISACLTWQETEIQPSDDHMGLALGVDTLVTAVESFSSNRRGGHEGWVEARN